MPLYRFLLYWLADRTRALILFSSFLVPVSLRVCGAYVCVLGLHAVATCFVKIRTIFRGASGDVLHLRDVRVHASLIRAHEFLRSSLFAVSPHISFLCELFTNYPCIVYDRDMCIEIANNDHGTIAISWYVVGLWSRYRMTSVISPDSQIALLYKHWKKSKHGRGGSTNYSRSTVALTRIVVYAYL